MATRGRAPARIRPFKPFRAPTSPPPGTFDPSLQQQYRAAQRGFQDLTGDTQLQGLRSTDDYNLGVQNAQQGLARSLADLNTRQQRENASYNTNTQDLGRSYTILGQNQDQQQRVALGGASGAGAGGAALAAAMARATNQGLAQTKLDTAHGYNLADISTAQQRANEDEQNQLGALGTTYQRGTQDSATQLSRAGRELGFMGPDVAAQEFYQAAGTGYVPPTAPANEYTRFGVTYRRGPGGQRYLPSGRRVSLAQIRSLYQR